MAGLTGSLAKNSMDRNWAVWGNENPSGPNYEHEEDCRCINCEMKRVEDAEAKADREEDR